MALTISLIITLFVVYFFSKFIREYALMFYLLGAAVAFEGILKIVLNYQDYELAYFTFFNHFMEALNKGIISTAIFILVMYAGALPTKMKLYKQLMICRGELSIFASLLILPHLIYYSYEFILSLNHLSKLNGLVLWGILIGVISGVVAGLIMLPLYITSYRNIRRYLGGKKWKALQEYAYIFYALVYIHIFAEWISKAPDNRSIYSMTLYTVLFFTYLVLKTKKVNKQKQVRLKVGGVK